MESLELRPHGERTMEALAQWIDLPLAKVSEHLQYLRKASLESAQIGRLRPSRARGRTSTAQRSPRHSALHGIPSPLPSRPVTPHWIRWKRASAQESICRQ
jgi:hypothetical protein